MATVISDSISAYKGGIIAIDIKTGKYRVYLSYNMISDSDHVPEDVVKRILSNQSAYGWNKDSLDSFDDTVYANGIYAYNGYTFIYNKLPKKGTAKERIKGAILLAKRYYESTNTDWGYYYGLCNGYEDGYNNGYEDAIKDLLKHKETYQQLVNMYDRKQTKYRYDDTRWNGYPKVFS